MTERTLVLIKPDGVERKLIGKIINFYEDKNLNIIAMKMTKPDLNTVEEHYIEHRGKDYFKDLIQYITEERLVAMVIEGEHAIELVRKINGLTDPLNSDMGSIRGRFACDKQRNLVHASDSADSAKREISIWFPELNNT
ncbi:MAG: ndkA1 [Clostridiaceae bacterium]|jgi:nucleoside-diphosphate kinase|nr:ndkA1 [Clostridiaceae bacterium]